ncbi:hypothetical protein [Streptomyces sp. VN1]|uniref:hypothetical protein n=1 Tax=Streptomyces sp. VN1 TaxID=1821625 RepID=UPI001413CAC6|nr:hypothetical protein [Streptomyces sp. VN1]QIP74739.1 hypothetical protein EZV63_36925 [Streptomyces sp. VN1]
MQKSASRTTGISIPAPASRPRLVLVGKKGPAFSTPCADCNGFDTVVIRRNGQAVTVRCTCQLAVSA